MRLIEDLLVKSLYKVLRKKVAVSKGPFFETKFTGVHPEVFIHASKLIDFGGIMPDGARTVRRPALGPATYKGFEEERPGQIVLLITCISGTYTLLQNVCKVVAATILSSLQMLPKIPLGSLPDKSTQLHFEDFTSNLHSEQLDRVTVDEVAYFKGELIFHLNGFIHVLVTKRGGFSSKSTSREKLRTRKSLSRKSKSPKRKKKR